MQAEATYPDLSPAIKTLLVTDLVGSTELFARLGDRRASEISSRHERLARDLLPLNDGREIDKTDGFLLLFDRPLDAVRYALEYHRRLAELGEELGVDLSARAGIHLGEVYLRANAPDDVARGAKPIEIEGFAKPIAARVMSLGRRRQTLLTRSAFDLARQAAVDAEGLLAADSLAWLAHGAYELKGVPEPVEIFEVGVTGFAPLAVPPGSIKARRTVSEGDELTLGWRPAPGLEVPRRRHWRIDSRLGEGGFGEVWLAVHATTGEKRVFKFCYHADRLRSLQREVTLFRLLKETLGNRDDIARIVGWNFDRAPYFLEGEYTEGGNLLEWVEAQGGASEVPMEVRIDLCAQVADALAAAHSVGVLHKDVKPSNVLITAGAPRVRLTDFGIGQVLDRAVLDERGITLFGLTEMVADGDETRSHGGTRMYTAPELLKGEVPTVQADIYALGVLLYQFVVGDFQHTLAPGWDRDVHDPLLSADLAEMVDGSPERRIGSAQEVAERLRALEERRARREADRRERTERAAAARALAEAQRRRRLSLTIAAVAVAVLAVVSFLALQALDARREAQRRQAQAESLITFMIGDLRKKLEPLGKLDVLEEVGDEAIRYFAQIPSEAMSDDELYRQSETLRQIGDLQITAGDLPAALETHRASLEIARALVDERPDHPTWLKGLGASHFWVGSVHWRQGELDLAEEHWRAYLEVAQRLSEVAPDDPEAIREVAYATANVGTAQMHRGEPAEAARSFRHSIALREGLITRDPTRDDWQLDLANAHGKLAEALERSGRLEVALDHYRTELLLRQEHESEEPRLRAAIAVAQNRVGATLESLGATTEALHHYRSAEQTVEELLAHDPDNTRWRLVHGSNLLRIGRALQALGDRSGALVELRRGRETFRELVALDPTNLRWRQDLAGGHLYAAEVFLLLGQLEAAATSVNEAREVIDELSVAAPEDTTIQSLETIASLAAGEVAQRLGDETSARRLRLRALEEIERAARGTSDWRLLDPYARSLLVLGETERAREVAGRLEEMGYRDRLFVAFCQRHGLDPSDPTTSPAVAGSLADPRRQEEPG